MNAVIDGATEVTMRVESNIGFKYRCEDFTHVVFGRF